MTTTTLASMQQAFAAALLDVECVAPLLPLFKGQAENTRACFATYRGNQIALWQQTCANAYPVLQQLLGTDFFNDLARMYGQSHSSHSGNLADFGAELPDFISTLESCRPYPYLTDVARLEWCVHRAYYLPHQPAASLKQLASFAPEHLGDLHFRLQPCCALLNSAFATGPIWQAHQPVAGELPADWQQPSGCLIWRPDWTDGWRVQVDCISPGAMIALQSLSDGATLGTALEAAMETEPTFAFQPALADWFGKQLFSHIELHQENIHHDAST